MTRKSRLSIAGLMGAVVVAALALAALRSQSAAWTGGTILAACGVLALGVVGAICRGGAERAWWLGFSIFGWGYLLAVLFVPNGFIHSPLTALAVFVRPSAVPGGMGGGAGPVGGLMPSNYAYDNGIWYRVHFWVGHSLFSLALALIGGMVALFAFGRRAVGVEAIAVVGPSTEARAARRRLHRPWIAAILAFVATVSLVVAGLRWAPWIACAATMYATWAVLGLAVVAAVCRRRRSRAAWLGAALFGIGYLVLIFGQPPDRPNWPRAVTDVMLRTVSPAWHVDEAPPASAGAIIINGWIREVLERPITLRYPEETAFKDVLDAIRASARGPDGRAPTFQVDPIGLQDADRTMTSPVTIDVHDVPLRRALKLILSQLHLAYGIHDGMVFIISDMVEEPIPSDIGVDAYLSVGHSLLVLLAAGLGWALAGRFCAGRDEQAMSI